MNWRLLIVGVCAMALSGCATTSFAPSSVAVDESRKDLAGGIAYVDSFVEVYRDRANETANGRQWYEIPGFLGTFGGAVARGPDAGLVGAGVTALAGAGNAYHAPKVKSALYSSALSALLCIQQVAVGVEPYETGATAAVFDAEVGDDVTTYYLIKNAALSVESILRTRLSNAGSVTDAAGIAAEYLKLVKEQAEAKARVGGGGGSAQSLLRTTQADPEAVARILQLRADLQLCILRAKA